MATSLRESASCIGVGGTFSVIRDYFGYRTRSFGHPSIDVDPMATPTTPISSTDPGQASIKRQIQLLKARFFNLDVIRVGGSSFTRTENIEIDVAVHVARNLYERIEIGIGRIQWSDISEADAGGYMSIDSPCEAIDLIDDWSAPGGGIDCFFVRDITYGKGGGTPTKGDGLLVQLRGTWVSGLALGHELGHFLGVDYHLGNRSFLMVTANPKAPYKWRPEEIDIIQDHDAMKGGCP